jgi:uncharacterized cupredoxin-like copper-binding protein
LTLLITLSAIALVAAACGGDESTEGPGDSSDATVLMTDELRFEPEVISVTAGEPVQLSIDNSESSVLHDFTIDLIPVTAVITDGESSDGGHMSGIGHGGGSNDYDLHIAVDAGEVGVIEFTPTETGEFEIHCTVVGHTEAGMVAKLVVD